MILEDCHSNLVILADGLKACITSIHSNALMAESEAQQIVAGNRKTFTELARPIFYKSHQMYSELNLIMYSAFFLESYINIYDFAESSSDPNYKFEEFSKMPTSKKWEKHFSSSQEFLGEVRNLFSFRNFLVHSKPIRRNDGKNEVYVKGTGWIPVSSISTFISNDLGLTQENFSVDQLFQVCQLIDNSVDLIESKSPGFNRHYYLKPRGDIQLEEIRNLNESYLNLSKKLLADSQYVDALKKMNLPKRY